MLRARLSGYLNGVNSTQDNASTPPLDAAELKLACERLRSGDVVAMPTETVYGLAASIESEAGIRKIFALKERPFFDPLIVHVESFKQAQSLVKEWPATADYLTRVFWPGPLTIILPKADHVNSLITSGLETVALRKPAHPYALELIKAVGAPLAAPSANKFGKTSPSTADHVRSEFKDSGLLVLDGGECRVGVESTVISFGLTEIGEDEVRILRPGGVTTEMLREALDRFSRPTSIRRMASDASPGHLKHHYMPQIPLIIVDENEPRGLNFATREKIQGSFKMNSILNATELELSHDPAMAARELYATMRTLGQDNKIDLLYVKRPTTSRTGGLWMAIWDRLNRAASLDLTNPG